jgi:hypothetical protein
VEDSKWDGLKGYLTNTDMPKDEVIGNYGQLWKIEKAFHISKTDLRIRPIYHRLQRGIEAISASPSAPIKFIRNWKGCSWKRNPA